jgi:hypothetical protein
MTSIFVTKRSGETEPFNINKIHRVLEWACNDLVGVSISEIEMRANIQLYNEMESVNIHDLLIKSSAELITEATPNYQTVAARLINYKLKKIVLLKRRSLVLNQVKSLFWPLFKSSNQHFVLEFLKANLFLHF